MTDWGQAATAHFHGSGSPVGVVTPGGIGDLYVDDTTPALWQATGLTSADWSQVGGGGSQPVREATQTFTDVDLAAAISQATALQVAPAPGAGKIIVPLFLAVTTANPDAIGNASVVGWYGAAGDTVTFNPNVFFNQTLAWSSGLGNGGNAGDVDQPFLISQQNGPITVGSGPYVVTLLYYAPPVA